MRKTYFSCMNSPIKILAFVIILVFSVSSCAPTRHVVPLGRKERAVSVSVGGPIVNRANSTIPVPIPLASVSYAYGTTKKNTRIAALHLTPIAVGVYHIEGGFLREFWYSSKTKMGFTGNLMGNLLFDRWEWGFKFYPQVDLNFYWHFAGDAHYFCDCPKDRGINMFLYAGIGNWFELDKTNDATLAGGQRILSAPHFGYNFGTKRTKGNLELKYYLPYVENNNLIGYYNPLNNYGAFGLSLGVYRLF